MTDELARDVAPDDVPRCTWCSAELPSPEATVCPSCGATLVGEGDPQLPGVTALDTEAIIKAARSSSQRPRSRLLSWISGEYEDAPAQSTVAAAGPDSLAPPPPEVRREMLRIELAAEVANLEAEATSIVTDAEIEARDEGWVPADEKLAAAGGNGVAPDDGTST